MHKIEIAEFSAKPFHLLDQEWALLVGGTARPNPMTVSWGGFGTLWMKPVVTVYVRPTRHTWGLLNGHPEFTLNVLPGTMKKALQVCGSTSGRDSDKWVTAGLEPAPAEAVAVPRVAGARVVFECRTLGTAQVDPSAFVDPELEKLYAQKDYHRLYFGEVLGVFSS